MVRIFTHPQFRRHDTGPGHPERPSRLDAALEGVQRAGMSSRVIEPASEHPETGRLIAKVHSSTYEQELERACRSGSRLFHSVDNPISSATHSAARAAVSTALTAADSILDPEPGSRSFVIARPPGHHAERLSAMGFCFFNTIACAAEAFLEKDGIARVFILDWDVHHGNGTQHLFETREDVFFLSAHRYPFYPGTGAREETGAGAGEGFTSNIPLNAGSGDSAYLGAFEKFVIPAIDAFRPDAILISAGFDAHSRDPLGGMRVSESAFGEMTRQTVAAAEKHCGGRVLSLLEGGYDLEGLASSVAEHVIALE